MSSLSILRNYAQKVPAELPPSILFTHTERTVTIFDAFPKSIFHFLVLPRYPQPGSTLSLHDLSDLRALLKADRAAAKDLILALKEVSLSVRNEIEQEMAKRYGFKWDVWTGFHAVASMQHLHLHVMSADLCSDKMKHKKHYYSFHPGRGFFLDVDEVLSWFDAQDSWFSTMSKLPKAQYEDLLKGTLSCFRCEAEFQNIPKLKAHLQEEFSSMQMREKVRLEKKRKWDERRAVNADEQDLQMKKQKADTSEKDESSSSTEDDSLVQ